MKEKGYIFNDLSNDIIHFCITSRFISNPDETDKFINMIFKSISDIKNRI